MAKGGKFSDGTIVIGTTVDTAGINSGLMKIRSSFKKLSLTLAGFLGVQSLVQLGRAAINAASELQEVQNIVDVTFGDLEWKMEAFASTAIDAYGMSEFMAKSVAGQFMAMGKAAGIAADDAANMALQLTALAGDMASFYNISQDYARVALSAVYTGETETLKRYGIILTEANLQEYAHSIGIETSVKKLDAKSKAMLRYQYILEQTQHIQGDFIRTEENWANQVRVLQERWRQFLITLGSGLITVFNPVVKMLNMLLRYVTAWANAIGKVLAKLLGLKWQDFAEETAQLSDATAELADNEDALGDSIATAGKKAKKSLAPFDELNVLTRDTSKDASGLATDLGIAIEDFKTAFDVKGGGFEFELPDIENWYDFGKYLSDTFANILKKIDWDKIKEGARTLGKNFADFFNGIFQPDDFATIGETIAEGLNTVLEGGYSFLSTFDFTNMGLSFAAAINKFFATFDFGLLAEGFNLFVQGIWDALKTFFAGDENGEGGLDWPLIKSKLKEFFSHIDIDTIDLFVSYLLITKVMKVRLVGEAAVAIAKGIAKQVGPILGRLFLVFAAKVMSAPAAIKGFIQEFKLQAYLKAISKGLATEQPALEAGMSLGQMLLNGIAMAVAAIGGSIIGTNLGGVLETLLGGDGSTYKKYMGLTGFIDMYKDLGIAIADVVGDFDLFKGAMKEAFSDTAIGQLLPNIKSAFEGISTWLGDIGYAISHIFEDAVENVKTAWGIIAEWFDTTIIQPIADKFNAFAQWWNGIFTWIGSVFQTAWIIAKAAWEIAADWFHDTVIQPIVDYFTYWWTTTKESAQFLWGFIQYLWGQASTWFDEKVIKPICAFVEVAVYLATNALQGLWNWFVSTYSQAFAWVHTNIIQPILNGYNNLILEIQTGINAFMIIIKDVWSSLITWFDTNVVQKILGLCQNIWDGIISGVKSSINTGIYVIESFINYIIDAINKFTSGISQIGEVAALITGDDYSGIGKISHVNLPRLASGAVIPPNNEFAAILGDQKHGTNIEAPLDTIVQAFKTALNENDSNTVMMLMQQQVALLEIIADKEFGITDSQIFNSVKKSASRFTATTGESAF